MFTWRELLDMGVRQRGHWLQQAEAIKRQNIATLAHAVGLGMADSKDRQSAFDALELTRTAKEGKKQLSESFWGLTNFFKRRKQKRGKGV